MGRSHAVAPSRWVLAASLAVLPAMALLSCAALGNKPVVVDDSNVVVLPSGYSIVHRDTTSCRGAEEAGWQWRDLVVRASPAGESSLDGLVRSFEERGFHFDQPHAPSKSGGWFSRTGSNGTVGVEIGTGRDYIEFGTIGDTNAAVAARAGSADTFVVRLKPEHTDCMV